MELGEGILIAFAVFIALLLGFIAWSVRAVQKSLDRQFDARMSEEKRRQAMKKLPP